MDDGVHVKEVKLSEGLDVVAGLLDVIGNMVVLVSVQDDLQLCFAVLFQVQCVRCLAVRSR